jgi:hypothetical protein
MTILGSIQYWSLTFVINATIFRIMPTMHILFLSFCSSPSRSFPSFTTPKRVSALQTLKHTVNVSLIGTVNFDVFSNSLTCDAWARLGCKEAVVEATKRKKRHVDYEADCAEFSEL